MARHASPARPTARRALVVLATAGIAAGAGAASAAADALPLVGGHSGSVGTLDPQRGLQALTGSVGYATGPVAGLKPNPLAGTGVDPLDNGVATQVADFKPIGSRMLTGPVTQAPSIGSIPVLGQATGLLQH
ncbi:hypothetical protein [Streptomyces tropicalis]|uniref:ATP-binding protein n=1 Tax=Streptomyces tropicalis TaxID=3034234 RepID=A0ABT6A0R1_9ACTN|nr:hypothetical protein [Streptomyces tropicalis]MDF3298230.1 hypothetical protein [Streptomyces tropicalis]